MAYEEGYEFVEVPVNVRTFVGEVSEVIHSYELSDDDYYPVGGSWAEVGLLTHDGGPEWVIKNITSDSYMWEGRDAAISAGEFDIYLRVVAAKTSPIIAALSSSGSIDSPDTLSLTHPLSQKWWLIFHEETFRSGAKRRRVFYARAFVVEQRMERNQVLAHEITFKLLPIASVVGEGEEIVAGGLDVAKLDSKGNLISKVPAVKDTKPGSGMPGSSSTSTLPPAGSTSGKIEPISAVIEPMGDVPRNLSDLRKKESVMFGYKFKALKLKDNQTNSDVNFGETSGSGLRYNTYIVTGSDFSQWISYTPFEVDSNLVGVNFKSTKVVVQRNGVTNLVFGLYEGSSNGKGNTPGRLIKNLGSVKVESDDYYVRRELSSLIPGGGWRFKKKGLYFIGMKVVHVGDVGSGLGILSGAYGNSAFQAESAEYKIDIKTNAYESVFYQNTGSDSLSMPANAEAVLYRTGTIQPVIFLSTEAS